MFLKEHYDVRRCMYINVRMFSKWQEGKGLGVSGPFYGSSF